MFNLADYETVEVRLEKFIKDYPDFRVATELEVCEKDRYIVKAYLFKDSQSSAALSTGLAEEQVTDRGVNSTSALENCETSAIGRALANAGYAAKGKRASREEMTKVVKGAKPLLKVVEDNKDYWTTPFGEMGEELRKVDAPVTIDQAIDTVAEIMGSTKVVPQCKHEPMVWKDGNKNGRAWGGYFCNGYTEQSMKCPTLWYQLTSSGSWEPQKARV